jgi:hypothetical protein
MHQGNSYEAVLLDVSLTGAFLSSKCMPKIGESVTLKLKTPNSKNGIELVGKIIRGVWVVSDHGKLGRFSIRFSHTPLDLIMFINKLK